MKSLAALALSLLAVAPMNAAVVPIDGTDLLVPVAGFAAGARGELFQTDLTLVNLSRASHSILLTWLPHGGTTAPVTRTVTLEGFAFRTLVAVVATTFETNGVGAIRVQSSAAGAIDAHARIWTESTCGSIQGTVSQSVPAIALETWREMSPAYIHGVRQSAGFRTNYGIVNLSSNARDFRVLINSHSGRREERVTVPANGMVHRGAPAGVEPDLSIYIEPLGSLPASGTWRAYAATTDNQSGSGWTVIAIQPRTDIQF